jgi:hypothetical protein
MNYLCYSLSILNSIWIVNYFIYTFCIDLYTVLCYILDMNANTDTYTKPFIVKKRREIDESLSILKPKVTIKDILGDSVKDTRLQAKMLVYDIVHKTQYRQVRNQLVQEQRNREFEEAIGIVRIE